jgi:subtilisin family serine protease
MEKAIETGRKTPVIIRFRNLSSYADCCNHLAPINHPFKKMEFIKSISCHMCDEDLNSLKKHSSILSVEKDSIVKLHQETARDSEQIPWGVQRIGIPRLPDSIINETRVKVGILDTGVDLSHPDLAANISGGIHLLSPFAPPSDDNGHGTHVAGTVAALHNRFGVVGVSPITQIYAIKVFDREGNANNSDIIRGIEWAIRQQIKILNMSFGTDQRSDAMRNALKKADSSGMVLIASAGNDGKANSVDYPARYPGVIAVGATNQNNRIASFSSRGKQVDLVAPGEDILSTGLNNGYLKLSGTSMSAPHVSGLVALMLSQYPSLTPKQINYVLKRTAIKISGVSPSAQGSGFIYAPRVFRFLKRRLLKK